MESKKSFQELLKGFADPSEEYSAIPFWFLNDSLCDGELIRQLDDFYSKGIRGVVLHPRIGIPDDTEYLGEKFMHAIKLCVEHAAQLGMFVVLYDEGMYPSGSACGLVAKQNPHFAARGLYAMKYEAEPPVILKNEILISLYALRFENGILCEYHRLNANGTIFTTGKYPSREFEKYAVICGYTGGTIRGIHFGEDDGEPNAPLAGDLLGRDSVGAFISLTHERYYSCLGKYFGNTIKAFFTDEPDTAGRKSKMPDHRVWTEDFLPDFEAECGGEDLLPALLFECEQSAPARLAHSRAVHKRLEKNYYGRLRRWCEEHGIALCGHPDKSSAFGLQKQFSVPGQDVVWRMIAPEKNLTSPDSVTAKCSSDMARHTGKRRNSNEVFGACGRDGEWDFPYWDMLWYLNFLFVRGVNMIFPHAFYYSVRGAERLGERPPDVGPNNIWWSEYGTIAAFISRMSYLNTDCVNTPACAVLCDDEYMPYKLVKPLYENQIPFNYVLPEMLDASQAEHPYKYSLVLAEKGMESPRGLSENITYAAFDAAHTDEIFDTVSNAALCDYDFTVNAGNRADLRCERLLHGATQVFILCNEHGEDGSGLCGAISGTLRIKHGQGRMYELNPFTGTAKHRYTYFDNGNTLCAEFELSAASLTVFALNPEEEACTVPHAHTEECVLSFSEKSVSKPVADKDGFLVYEIRGSVTVTCTADEESRYILALPTVSERVDIYVNARHIATLLSPPWRTDVTDYVNEGENEVTLRITKGAKHRVTTSSVTDN